MILTLNQYQGKRVQQRQDIGKRNKMYWCIFYNRLPYLTNCHFGEQSYYQRYFTNEESRTLSDGMIHPGCTTSDLQSNDTNPGVLMETLVPAALSRCCSFLSKGFVAVKTGQVSTSHPYWIPNSQRCSALLILCLLYIPHSPFIFLQHCLDYEKYPLLPA